MGSKDAVYYACLMGGIIVGTLILRPLGVEGIWLLLGAIAFGVGFGFLADRLLAKRQ